MPRLKLNCDVGEYHSLLENGAQAELLSLVDWANIACGGHAGDEGLMAATLEQCLMFDVQAGAHPSYPDRVYFGREPISMPHSELADSVYDQLKTLDKVAQALGIPLRHVKPHGALYNTAATDAEVAKAIGEAVGRWNRQATILGLAGSPCLKIWEEMGFRTAAEAFADRRYDSNGLLRPRALENALIHQPAEAADQATRLARVGEIVAYSGQVIAMQADTICVHSDSPNAVAIVREIRTRIPKESRAPQQMVL